MKKILVGTCAALSMVSSFAMADSTPVMFSSLNGFNAPAASEVTGVRLAALHGKTGDITGVDFALGMSESDNLTGVNFPLFIGANKVNGNMTGASFGLFNWHKGEDLGANLGFVNITNNVKGANLSAVNYSEGYTMVDVGVANLSNDSHVQVGFFNMTSEIKGVQVGLINCAENGFLPCFPIVNFAM
ncbi:VC2662 family protein [Aliivibrio sifiae]|uniref:PhaC PHA synthase n=1 Tax=Aliivibrio sifiae TaxID=566293 RepID=A0A2S7XF17_9GAMM|nr:phaC PHA synthase [Aliivibrio sifiae]PQJ89867.1 phaC PHA synthase [Aliivibrio sifiae]